MPLSFGSQKPEFLLELEKTLALLAFQDPSSSPLGTLMVRGGVGEPRFGRHEAGIY